MVYGTLSTTEPTTQPTNALSTAQPTHMTNTPLSVVIKGSDGREAVIMRIGQALINIFML